MQGHLLREGDSATLLTLHQMDFTSSRFELVVVWRMHMEEEGKVFPKLDLLPKVPQQGRGPQGKC